MFLLCHEDAYGCEYGDPVTFETASAAIEYAAARADTPLLEGHSIVLYECRQVRVLRGAGHTTAPSRRGEHSPA